MCLKLYIHSLEDVTAPSGQSDLTAEVKISAILWFHLVLDQWGEAYKSISCSLTLWRRYSSYSFFWRGNNSVKQTPTLAFLLLLPQQSRSVPFWSWPPPEHIPASPAVAFSVCQTELVESYEEMKGNASGSKNCFSFNNKKKCEPDHSSWFHKRGKIAVKYYRRKQRLR